MAIERIWKKCSSCQKRRPLHKFNKMKSSPDSHQRECRNCGILRRRREREENPGSGMAYLKRRPRSEEQRQRQLDLKTDWRKRNPGKVEASKKLRRAILMGDVAPRPSTCSYCPSTTRIEGHHFSDKEPTDVIWLCCTCHALLHRGKTKKAEKIRKFIAKLIDKKGGK